MFKACNISEVLNPNKYSNDLKKLRELDQLKKAAKTDVENKEVDQKACELRRTVAKTEAYQNNCTKYIEELQGKMDRVVEEMVKDKWDPNFFEARNRPIMMECHEKEGWNRLLSNWEFEAIMSTKTYRNPMIGDATKEDLILGCILEHVQTFSKAGFRVSICTKGHFNVFKPVFTIDATANVARKHIQQ